MVRPKDILGDYDTITETEASSIGSQQNEFNKLVQGYNLFANSPFVNQIRLTQKVMEEGLKWKDFQELIVDPNKQANAGKKEQLLRADQENRDPRIAKVRQDDDHAVHLDVHDEFIRSESFQELPPELQQMLAAHREEHDQRQREATVAGRGGGSSPMPPGTPSVENEEEAGGDIVPGPGRPPLQTGSP